MERGKINKTWQGSLIQRAQTDPVWWIENVLGDHLWKKQRDIATALITNERVACPAAFGLGKCVEENERLVLATGEVVLAKDAVNKSFAVLAFDEATQQQIPAEAFAFCNGEKPVYRVRTRTGREIIRTGNHPLYSCAVLKKNTTLYPYSIRWRSIEELAKATNIAVAVPVKLEINNHDFLISDDEVKLLGYLLGDGGLTVGVTFTQQVGPAKSEFIEIIERLGCDARAVDHLTVAVRGKPQLNGKRFSAQNHTNTVFTLVKSWKLIGKTSREKQFPNWVWKFSNRQLALLLNRLFACDGWATATEKKDRAEVGITLGSKELVRDIELAMLRLGISGYFSERLHTNGPGKGKTYWSWRLHANESIRKFARVVGIFGKELAVNNCLDKIGDKNDSKHTPQWMYKGLDANYIWDKVVSIEYVGESKTVGITVPKYHTYLSTFVEHNTFLAARLALWFLYNFAPAKVISTAPTSRQVKDLLWSELRKAHAKARVALGGTPLQLSLTVAPNHYAVGFTPDDANYDAFTGYHSSNLLLVFDQAGGIPNVLWEAAEGLMTSQNCRWLAIGNTAISDGAFADVCMPERKSTFGTWKIIPITAEESPNVVAKRDIYPGLISHDWVEKRKLQWGETDPMYKIFVKAQFVPGVQMVVVPYEFLESGYNSYGEMDEEDEIEIGLDVARTGLDSTVWFARAGSRALEVKAVNGNDTMQVAGSTIEFIRQIEQKYQRKVRVTKIDIIGIGAGVYDRLLEQDVPVVAINNAAVEPVVDRERFSNVRAEMAWALRHRFEQREVGLRGLQEKQPEYFELLQRDIQVQKYEITSAGKILLWPKEKIKKELGRSPDYWDALVMAFEEPGGGPAQVNFLSSVDTQQPNLSNIFSISDDEWKTLLGEQIDINHPSFVSLRM